MNTEVLENWQEINATTLEFIRAIPNKMFQTKPFGSRFKSISWEFACILTTRIGYIRGIKSKVVNGASFTEQDDEIKTWNRNRIIKQLLKTDQEIKKIIKNKDNKKINHFGRLTSKTAVIYWLCQHEQLHYGKLMLYLAKVDLKIPKGLKRMWGEKSFSPHKKIYKL